MKMWMLAGTFALAVAGSLQAAQDAAGTRELKIGDKAPALDHVSWVQGGPVRDWEKDHVYVVDFWATWCGPCKASIPHINELAKKHGKDNVTVIGAAIWPRAKMVPTADFVKEKGDAMSYVIAEDIEGQTAKAWMEAAGQNGIPTAMVIDQGGRIAWIGHPMDGLDDVLEHVVKGDFDAKALAEAAARVEKLKADLGQAKQDENWARCAALADELLNLDVRRYGDFASYSYRYRLEAGDKAGAAEYGRSVTTGAIKDSAQALNGFAWMIVDPTDTSPTADRDLDLALAAAQRADELAKNADPSILDTVARVHFLKGNLDQAVTLQRMAVELASNEAMKADLQARLDEYTTAQAHG